MKHNNFTTSGNGKKKLYPIYKILLFISLQDRQIEHDKQTYSIFGGCAVIVALFLLGKLYVANAGDCRYINFVEIIQNLNNLILPFIFSSPGPKVHVNYCHHLVSVVCRLSSVNFSHFKLLLRNHLADWNRT